MARILITGCSSGFGFLAAEHFARRGDTVYATTREVESSVRNLTKKYKSCRVLRLDVTDTLSVNEALAKALNDGPLDAVVNNAGILLQGAVEDMDDQEIVRLFNTNVFGPIRVCRAALPSMRKARRGVFVNISSLSGIAAFPSEGIYGASKHALRGFSEALQMEIAAFGLRVRLIEPGSFPTTDIFAKSLQTARHFGSPYEPIVASFWDAVHSLQNEAPPPDPALVVNAIEKAIDNPKTPFEQPVGQDAEQVAAIRRKIPFEEFEARLREVIHWDPPQA